MMNLQRPIAEQPLGVQPAKLGSVFCLWLGCWIGLGLYASSQAQNASHIASLEQTEPWLIQAEQDELGRDGFAYSVPVEGSPEMTQPDASVMNTLPANPYELATSPSATSSFPTASRFFIDYDQGFVLRPSNPKTDPFELKISGWGQIRHHAMIQDAEVWQDRAGNVAPLRNRNLWDIERSRLILSGYAWDPRLTYFVNIDGDSDGGEFLDFFDYWFGWQIHDQQRLLLGKRKVPGSRQWILSARHTRLVDRPMACDFFRPDRTNGLAWTGKLGTVIHCDAMVGNGYRTANFLPDEQDTNFVYALSMAWDPRGDFGLYLSDYELTNDSRWRLGHSFVYSALNSSSENSITRETDFIRLADGTKLITPNAFGPGLTVASFDVFFYGLDAAWKGWGWSWNSELFFRWLSDLQFATPANRRDDFQKGFYVEGGKFLIARKFEVNARYSQVHDFTATANEYSLGSNFYPLTHPLMKLSFDATYLDGSPLQNTGSDILVGDRGMLFRSQFQVDF
jgi:hypothetical protein